MFDLRSLDATVWLAEPGRLRRGLAELAALPQLPGAREVARERRHRLDRARAAPTWAIPAGPTLAEPGAGQAIRAATGKVGILPIYGPVEQRTSCGGIALGGCSAEETGIALDALLADRSIGAIVLHVDSPGGGVPGVEELADQIKAAAAQKPVYASADSLAASAAYWLASQAGHLSVTPGGEVGAVGVFVVHVDQTEANREQGLNVNVIRAGEYKAEGNPFEPLSPEGRDYLQSQVDYVYSKFVRNVARGRGVPPAAVRSNYGRGRVVNADAALAGGMVDKIIPFRDLLDRLTGGRGSAALAPRQTAALASAEMLRLRHEMRKARSAEAPSTGGKTSACTTCRP